MASYMVLSNLGTSFELIVEADTLDELNDKLLNELRTRPEIESNIIFVKKLEAVKNISYSIIDNNIVNELKLSENEIAKS